MATQLGTGQLSTGLAWTAPERADSPASMAGIPSSLVRARCYLEVLIPARDEARRLPRTLLSVINYLEAQPYSSAIVVIDNGSVDRTVDLISHLPSPHVPVHLLGCAQPGKGAAVRRGILTSSARFVGFMDADLATPIETLDMALPMLEAGCQAVVGSRRARGATVAEPEPRQRILGGLLFKALARRIVPGIADTQCGFKIFDGDLAREAASQLSVEGFAFDVELLRTITEMGVGIAEVPVVWSHQAGSTLRAMRDGIRGAADVLRLAHRRGYL